LLLFLTNCSQNNQKRHWKELPVSFEGRAKIEVGGPYAGTEFHDSQMVPQRISFFYPVANSLDNSRDYWTRDTSFIGDWYLKIGGNPKIWLNKLQCEIELTPYSVVFFHENKDYAINSSYRFCKNKPALVLTVEIENSQDETKEYQFETGLRNYLRSSHSYRVYKHSRSTINNGDIFISYKFPGLDSAQVFVANVGARPDYINNNGTILSEDEKSRNHVSQFIYKKRLKSGESMNIIQIIGSAKPKESESTVNYLKKNYNREINQYNRSILQKIRPGILRTGYDHIDHSLAYAHSVIEANAHYLDGEIVPMPCPAEYNFYFTHDALVTDLAVVKFDPERVKEDLEFIIRHANEDNIIPHAYYWKDEDYVTEYAGKDNWNNFWFIQVCAKYLRYSGDQDFLKKLYPYIFKCVEQALLTLEDDNLIWSYRPDWWDIGHNYGPRSYMTILAIKSLRDYIYLCTVLDKNPKRIQNYTELSKKMETALNNKLWNQEMKYLVNYYNDGSLDPHYYIGSLLGVYYNLLDSKKGNHLIQTARQKLLDKKIGLYNAYPMDFHKLGDLMNFSANEAGRKYHYFNGGVWSQGNAWYALALITKGQKKEAADFIDRVMSLHGIMNGPNGQPAYYEVRNANQSNPDQYGTADKPQFLWAAAWYIKAMYRLYGTADNSWNITFDPFLKSDQDKCEYKLFIDGKKINVTVMGKGSTIGNILYDNREVAAAVCPEIMPDIQQIKIKLGKPEYPYLKYTNTILDSCEFDNNELKIILSAYPGHSNKTNIISPRLPKNVMIDGVNDDSWIPIEHQDYQEIKLSFVHKKASAQVILEF